MTPRLATARLNKVAGHFFLKVHEPMAPSGEVLLECLQHSFQFSLGEIGVQLPG